MYGRDVTHKTAQLVLLEGGKSDVERILKSRKCLTIQKGGPERLVYSSS